MELVNFAFVSIRITLSRSCSNCLNVGMNSFSLNFKIVFDFTVTSDFHFHFLSGTSGQMTAVVDSLEFFLYLVVFHLFLLCCFLFC